MDDVQLEVITDLALGPEPSVLELVAQPKVEATVSSGLEPEHL